MRSLLSMRWWILAGIGAGFLAWAYDYRFFVNPGGPEAPISTAIDRYSHLQDASFPLITLWPAVVLVVGGALVAFALGWVFTRFIFRRDV
jgi:hypothetical protein